MVKFFSLPRNFIFNSALDLDFPQMVLAVVGRSEDTAKRKVTVGTSVFCGLGNASPIERIDLLKTVPKTIIFPLEIVPPIRKHEFSKPYFSGASC